MNKPTTTATTPRQPQQSPQQQQSKTKTKKRVSFGEDSTLFYDGTLSKQERDLIWYDPDALKTQARNEISLARRLWKNRMMHTMRTTGDEPYCWRGLEQRLKSSEATQKKWYTFLHSFLALQGDVRRFQDSANNANQNLLSVFCSANSKTDRAKAHQRGLQDEVAAFQIHQLLPTKAVVGVAGKNKLHLSPEKRGSLSSQTSNGDQQKMKKKSSTNCPRARSA